MLLIDVNLSLGVSDVGTRAAALAQPSTVSSSSRSACSRLDSILNSVMDHLKEVCALYENVYELFPLSCNHDILNLYAFTPLCAEWGLYKYGAVNVFCARIYYLRPQRFPRMMSKDIKFG